jgi:cytolysin-activating lysine-acyltransferase
LFYHEAQPAAAVIYARISPEVQARLRNEGEAAKLSFDEWQSGNNVWIVQVISPFGFGDPFMVETLQTLSAARPDASTPAGMS